MLHTVPKRKAIVTLGRRDREDASHREAPQSIRRQREWKKNMAGALTVVSSGRNWRSSLSKLSKD